MQVFTGERPYNDSEHSDDPSVILDVIRGIKPNRPTDREVIDRGLSDDLWRVLEIMWSYSPQSRPRAKRVCELLEDPSLTVSPPPVSQTVFTLSSSLAPPTTLSRTRSSSSVSSSAAPVFAKSNARRNMRWWLTNIDIPMAELWILLPIIITYPLNSLMLVCQHPALTYHMKASWDCEWLIHIRLSLLRHLTGRFFRSVEVSSFSSPHHTTANIMAFLTWSSARCLQLTFLSDQWVYWNLPWCFWDALARYCFSQTFFQSFGFSSDAKLPIDVVALAKLRPGVRSGRILSPDVVKCPLLVLFYKSAFVSTVTPPRAGAHAVPIV